MYLQYTRIKLNICSYDYGSVDMAVFGQQKF